MTLAERLQGLADGLHGQGAIDDDEADLLDEAVGRLDGELYRNLAKRSEGKIVGYLAALRDQRGDGTFDEQVWQEGTEVVSASVNVAHSWQIEHDDDGTMRLASAADPSDMGHAVLASGHAVFGGAPRSVESIELTDDELEMIEGFREEMQTHLDEIDSA